MKAKGAAGRHWSGCIIAAGMWVWLVPGGAFAETSVRLAMAETNTVLAEIAKSDWSAVVARSDAALLKTASPKAQMRLMAAEEKSSGRLQTAKAHKATRYNQGEVLLAVDYSGETASRTIVCGFVLWSGATEDVLKIRRIETSYLPAALFKDLKDQKVRVNLAVAMAQLRCPPALIERLVGVKVR